MIFKIHKENTFGIKQLTDADLGKGISHQTHIGLYDGVLTNLNDIDEIKESYLLFNDNCWRLDCYFDRIENPDGTFRSPKIRFGDTDSIVRKIREIASVKNTPLYLMWFGLDNGDIVFLLFDQSSMDFNFLSNRIEFNDKYQFSKEIMTYVVNRFNETNEGILSELEKTSQGIPVNRHYRRIDIERANRLFKETGKYGEELVYKYLEQLKRREKILRLTWENKSRESGLPYDFRIMNTDHCETFIDVKTTRFNFDNPMIFSSQEVEFITDKSIQYSVYRAYNIAKENPLLRICDNCRDKMDIVHTDYIPYKSRCFEHGYDVQSSFIVLPSDSILKFSPQISL